MKTITKEKDWIFEDSSMMDSILEMSREKGIPVETLIKFMKGELSLEEQSEVMKMTGMGVKPEDWEGNDYYHL